MWLRQVDNGNPKGKQVLCEVWRIFWVLVGQVGQTGQIGQVIQAGQVEQK